MRFETPAVAKQKSSLSTSIEEMMALIAFEFEEATVLTCPTTCSRLQEDKSEISCVKWSRE
jgi:hypothetical protein